MTHCCETMRDQVERTCPDHPDRSDCPDCLVEFRPDPAPRYGLLIHDGGTSSLAIGWCPWCGSKLPGGGS